VLVLLARFALTRLVPPFFVARTELPVRAGCFFADGCFRLERTALRAFDVFGREPAAPLFFDLRVGMAVSSLRPAP